MNKPLALLFVTLVLIAVATPSCLAIDVVINGRRLPSDPPAVERGGRTLLPVRPVFEALQADVTWEAATMTVTAVRRGTTVKMSINNPTAYINGQATPLDVPPQLINDRTYVPVRFPAEAFGAQVRWDAGTQTVTITLPETAGPPEGGGAPAGAPVVLVPREGDRVGTRIDFSIKTTPGVEQVIYTLVHKAGTNEVISNVPGIRHLPNADGTYQGGIATPRLVVEGQRVPVWYEIHFRNGPNDGDPETVVKVYPKD
jgi:hypothetical protein